MASAFRAEALSKCNGKGGGESRDVIISIVRCGNEREIDEVLLKIGNRDGNDGNDGVFSVSSKSSPSLPSPPPPPPPPTRRRNPRRSCAPIPSMAEIVESSTTKKKQKEESPYTKAAPPSTKRTTRAAAAARASAASTHSARTSSTSSPPPPPPPPPPSSAKPTATLQVSRKTNRSQSSKVTTAPTQPAKEQDETASATWNESSTPSISKSPTSLALTTFAALPPTTPIWLLLVSSSSSTTAATSIATYRILGRNGSNVSTTTEARKKKRRKKERGSRIMLTNCSGTATFTICPAPAPAPTSAAAAAAAAATGTSSFPPEQTIATRRRPSLPICLLQPYHRDSIHGDSSHSISTLQFQSLVEANYFSTTLRAVSRLMTCSSSSLGRTLAPSATSTSSTIDLSVERGLSGGGTTNQRHRRQQLANAAADEMLTGACSTLAVPFVDSGDGDVSSQVEGKGNGGATTTTTNNEDEDEDDFYFVTSGDIGNIPSYVFLLLAQAKRGRLNASDISRRSSSVGLIPGTLGIKCRHCCGRKGSGAYFPPNANKLSRSSAPCLHTHLQRCEDCPKSIKMALRREKNNRTTDSVSDSEVGTCSSEEAGEQQQQQHWQLLLDRIEDESFVGGDDDSRAVVKAHLSKLLTINDGGRREEEPKIRTADKVGGDVDAKDDDNAEEKGGEVEYIAAPVTTGIATGTTDFYASAASSDVDVRPRTPDLEMEPFGFAFAADAKASSTADDNSNGTDSSPGEGEADAALTASPRKTNEQQGKGEDQYSDWGLSPIPHDDIDDALIATPTRKFLSSLFNNDNCMTPFAFL